MLCFQFVWQAQTKLYLYKMILECWWLHWVFVNSGLGTGKNHLNYIPCLSSTHGAKLSGGQSHNTESTSTTQGTNMFSTVSYQGALHKCKVVQQARHALDQTCHYSTPLHSSLVQIMLTVTLRSPEQYTLSFTLCALFLTGTLDVCMTALPTLVPNQGATQGPEDTHHRAAAMCLFTLHSLQWLLTSTNWDEAWGSRSCL